MNKFIENQLNSCKVAHIPAFSPSSTHLTIPISSTTIFSNNSNQVPTDYEIGHTYLINIDSSLITPGQWYYTIHGKWNNRNGPKDSRVYGTVLEFAGKMVKFYTISEDRTREWEGWLPKGNTKIIKEMT